MFFSAWNERLLGTQWNARLTEDQHFPPPLWDDASHVIPRLSIERVNDHRPGGRRQ